MIKASSLAKDDSLNYFSYFAEKIRFGILCESSAWFTRNVNTYALWKMKANYVRVSLAKTMNAALRISSSRWEIIYIVRHENNVVWFSLESLHRRYY